MTAPLEGVTVLEVASWLAAPSCAALMADMGANVIKVEPPGGDSYRRLYAAMLGEDFVHPCYQFDNRGKRGVCINFDEPEGLEVVYDLARNADVFITNLTQPRLERYKLTDKHIHEISPSAVYAVLSAYGTSGTDSEREAFDQAAFWARTGAMSVFGDRDDEPLLSRGGYGDRVTGLNFLAAILAAMRVRDKTGEGQYVEVTLQSTGLWAMASDVGMSLYERTQPAKTSRQRPANPIWNQYKTLDDRWLVLVMPNPLPYWPAFCNQVVNRPEWATDERFQTVLGLTKHATAVVPDIEVMFKQHDLDHWRGVLDASGLIWEPVAELPEVIEDPALRERGAFSVVVHETGGAMEVVSAPFEIRDAEVEVRGPAPDTGQHTREVVSELGISNERIEELMSRGVLLQS